MTIKHGELRVTDEFIAEEAIMDAGILWAICFIVMVWFVNGCRTRCVECGTKSPPPIWTPSMTYKQWLEGTYCCSKCGTEVLYSTGEVWCGHSTWSMKVRRWWPVPFCVAVIAVVQNLPTPVPTVVPSPAERFVPDQPLIPQGTLPPSLSNKHDAITDE